METSELDGITEGEVSFVSGDTTSSNTGEVVDLESRRRHNKLREVYESFAATDRDPQVLELAECFVLRAKGLVEGHLIKPQGHPSTQEVIERERIAEEVNGYLEAYLKTTRFSDETGRPDTEAQAVLADRVVTQALALNRFSLRAEEKGLLPTHLHRLPIEHRVAVYEVLVDVTINRRHITPLTRRLNPEQKAARDALIADETSRQRVYKRDEREAYKQHDRLVRREEATERRLARSQKREEQKQYERDVRQAYKEYDQRELQARATRLKSLQQQVAEQTATLPPDVNNDGDLFANALLSRLEKANADGMHLSGRGTAEEAAEAMGVKEGIKALLETRNGGEPPPRSPKAGQRATPFGRTIS